MPSSKTTLSTIFRIVILLALASAACNLPSRLVEPTAPSAGQPTDTAQSPQDTPAGIEQPTPEIAATPTTPISLPGVQQDARLIFASFNEPVLNLSQPAVLIDGRPDWAAVYNPFLLSSEQIARLQQDGIVVSPGIEKEFFTVYEKARYGNIPIFVTSDALLHSYHLLFDKVLRTAEVEHFIPLLSSLNQAMLQRSTAIYEELKGSDWQADALRLVAFFGVGSRLLDAAVPVPSDASALVEAELALVNAAGGIAPSPLFPSLIYGEDYTQYIPRGHYTRSEALKAYFRSMMWYGRMTFLLKTNEPALGRADTRAALLLVQALQSATVDGRPALDAWMDLYSPTVFFVGRSDDLTALQYGDVIEEVYGANPTLQALADEGRLDAFIEAAAQLPPPRILGIVIMDSDNEEDATKGLRFMGQRFVPDAYIFRQLIYRNVGTQANRRGLPMGLDLLAAMGSERAYSILDQLGETSYEKYPEQMQKVRTWLASLSQAEWTETLYTTWLYSFYPLLETPAQGAPYFTQSLAWQDKQLNTALGSWAELKHDTILYAKQVYAELGGGPPPPKPIPPKGYVEPVPAFFARLGALTSMTIDGLSRRGLLSDADRDSLERLATLSYNLQAIAEKELRAEALSDAEYELIRFIGGELEHFVMASADTENADPFAPKYMDEQPQAAVIADVATDPDNALGHVVLEEGIGWIHEIHVVVPIVQADGSILWEVARGGVFSYYEFPWQASDRLTDESWRSMLDQGSAPALPAWTNTFRVTTSENEALRAAISTFHSYETSVFWTPDADYVEWYPAVAIFSGDKNLLFQQKQYEGRQLVQFQFLSFDLQSANQAVVTVRETWIGKLYAGEYPEEGNPPIGVRGPYTRTATYMVNFNPSDGRWTVSQANFDTQPPAWSQP